MGLGRMAMSREACVVHYYLSVSNDEQMQLSSLF